MCAAAFYSLFGVTKSRVRRLASESTESSCAPTDKRGKHSNRPKKISEEVRHQIDMHIRSFPAMKSHYSRNKVSRRRKYLSPQLNVTQMHELYLQKYEPGVENPLVFLQLVPSVFQPELQHFLWLS